MVGAFGNCRNNWHINTLLFLKITSINFCHRHIWNMGSFPPKKEKIIFFRFKPSHFRFLKLISILTIITQVTSNMNYQLGGILSEWRNEGQTRTSASYGLSMYSLLAGFPCNESVKWCFFKPRDSTNVQN